MNRDIFQIQQSLPYSDHLYLAAAQKMIDSVIPESCLLEENLTSRELFARLGRYLPILTYELINESNSNLCPPPIEKKQIQEQGVLIIKLLCYADFSHGVGRYITDLFNRWLIPGKRISSQGGLSLKFRFVHYPERSWYFCQKIFVFKELGDLSTVLSTLPRLIEEAKLNLLAVYQARSLASLKSLSPEQIHQIVQENLSSLFSIPYPVIDRSAYDQMQALILKISEEEKIREIKKNISSLRHYRSKNFDSDVFHEMTGFTTHYFREHFAILREPRHISKVIALHYLFKKALLQSIYRSSQERHIRIKLLKSHATGLNPTIGILVGINLFHETERFGRKHLLEAIQSCLPQVSTVPDSFIMDRSEEKARIFYLEIQKINNQSFCGSEIRALRQKLPALLKKSVENLVHPIFMPRNEEEVLRTIVLLSKQIRYLRDLPHLTIHYEKQTDTDISFLIVLVHLIKEKGPSFKELFKHSGSSLRIIIDEIRVVGSLKRRIPKEAVIFRAFLAKSPFVRRDYSLDLKRARQKVAAELRLLLGEFRDFNGGMIHKQDEALELLRTTLGPIATHHEVLLENFFYSLRPGIMQTVHSSEILRTLFDLLLKVLEEDLSQKEFSFKIASEKTYFFLMIGAVAPTFKEEAQAAIARLKIPSYDLTSSFLIVQDYATLGLIFRSEDPEKRKLLQQVLLEAMLNWKIHFSCQVKIS